MPAEERFVTRPFRDGDEEAILDLFARSFPHAPRSREHFDWKFRRDPFGNKRISLTFDDAGRLVGHYAAYAVPFRDGERNLMANQIGDTMTDASVRHIGRGPTSVLGRTALHFYETFCEGKVAFNYGFNVANLQRPDVRYAVIAIRKWRRLIGWIVFRIRDGRFSWGDALFDPRHEDAVEVMLRHVTASYPIEEIEAWFPPRPAWFDRVLARLGF